MPSRADYLVLLKREKGKMPRLNVGGWPFVILVGLILAVIALLDQGGFSLAAADAADGSTGCVVVVEVVDRELNLRDGPGTGSAVVRTVDDGTRLDATTVVTTTAEGDYRQMEDGTWAAVQYLVPEAGSTC